MQSRTRDYYEDVYIYGSRYFCGYTQLTGIEAQIFITEGHMMHKSISLTFRGFEISPDEVQSIVGIQATSFGTKGEPVRPGVKTLLRRSAVLYEIEFPNDCRWDEMIPALISHLGGVEHLRNAREKVNPEFFEFDITLPIKGSMEQENGYFPEQTIADLYTLKASLGIQVIDPNNGYAS